MPDQRTDAQTLALKRLEKKHGKLGRPWRAADGTLRVNVFDPQRERDVEKSISSSGLITEVS